MGPVDSAANSRSFGKRFERHYPHLRLHDLLSAILDRSQIFEPARNASCSAQRDENSAPISLLYYLKFLLVFLTVIRVKALVTTKGQVTIPKALRDKFGIEPGVEVDFVATADGIRLRKVVDHSKPRAVLGCLKRELAGRTAAEWLDELRGPVELPPARRKERRL